jgi:hypothetical protein
MKRESIILFLLFAGFCSGAYAHAGMADRMLNTMVSVGTIVYVIFIMQFLSGRWCTLLCIFLGNSFFDSDVRTDSKVPDA